MITHKLTQGSPEWHAYRANHFNASDAPAMMGASPYKTRSELLQELATGITPEVDSRTQAMFDKGHRFEALARPLAEEIIGDELYPVVGSDGKLSASFDGLTMLEDVGFEHKTLNAALRDAMTPGCAGDALPMVYQIQNEQQCMVSKAGRILFMASSWSDDDTLIEARHCWYESNAGLAKVIRAGWDQFAEDLAAFVPNVTEAKPVGRTMETLPALHIEVTGKVTASNLDAYKEHALAVFGGINRELTTDQHFADATLTVKWCEDVETRLAAAKQHALSQTETIDALFRTVDEISAEARRVRLELTRLVDARKAQIRLDVVTEAQAALAAHLKALNERLGKPYMPVITADFAGAIKGKRTVEGLRDAVDTLLAQTKITASATADKIDANLKTLRELASEHAFLFSDTSTIVLKACDDLTMLVKSRISEHKETEAKRLEKIDQDAAEKAKKDAAEAFTKAQAAVAAIRFPAPVVEVIRTPQPAGEPPAPMPPTPAPASLVTTNNAARAQIASTAPVVRTAPAHEVAWINTAAVSQALGLPVSADLLASIGHPATKRPGPGMWWDDSKLEAILSALVNHSTKALAAHRAREAVAA